MKKLFTLSFLLVCLFISAKAQIPGSRIDGPITLQSGLSVKEGDFLKLGKGSDRRGDFVYIYQPANALIGTPEQGAHRSIAGSEVQIKFFKSYGNKKIGKKTIAVINVGGLNQIVDLDAGIEQGEIIAINGQPVGDKPVQNTTQVSSVADELSKLKKLHDEGVISKEEFDAQKKKLLNQ